MPEVFSGTVVFGEDNARLEGASLLEIHERIGYDYDRIAHDNLACSRAIEADAAAAALATNDVCLETLAIVIVHNLHLLACNDSGRIHQILVDGDAAHVVEIRLRNGDTVQFRLQYFYHHIVLFVSYMVNESYGLLSAENRDAAYDALRLIPRRNICKRIQDDLVSLQQEIISND